MARRFREPFRRSGDVDLVPGSFVLRRLEAVFGQHPFHAGGRGLGRIDDRHLAASNFRDKRPEQRVVGAAQDQRIGPKVHDALERLAEDDFRLGRVGLATLDQVDELGPDDTFTVYLRAKKAAEDDLRSRDLDWTILRPGSLTNDPGTGLVLLADKVPRGNVPRDDVAAVLAGLCDTPAAIGRTLELISGNTPIADALKNLGERVQIAEVQSFVLAIRQANEFGISVSTVLRNSARPASACLSLLDVIAHLGDIDAVPRLVARLGQAADVALRPTL